MKPSRVRWDELPEPVRERVAEILGSPVTVTTVQTHGTTPGLASRVVTEDGTHAFVKISHPDINADIPNLNRREAAVLSFLPEAAPAPRLLGQIDVDGWAGIVTSDVEGPHPELPWSDEDITTTLAALSRLAETTAGFHEQWEPFSAQLQNYLSVWDTFMDNPPTDLDPWLAERMPDLAGRVERLAYHVSGDTIIHGAARSDNILLSSQGAVLVDWSHAVVGPAWVDAADLIIDIIHTDPLDAPKWNRADDLVNRVAAEFSPSTHGEPATEPIVDLMVAVLGLSERECRKPDPAGMPQLREFQRERASRLRAWLWASVHLA
ncbi:aminoglycoside phosphotransferase family protein [Cutibacterium sp.]|uniref:aminoglycoside phosphotransferase family protein n=1 Tax=Cutibacterium sp. TaxID=1912221 RepID=UPI0026DD002B|nr:aminoglycoside phosphotransferase family protein [Cutibacterium sp.]MDO4412698.1 aminoglycoside phosphotransferase family protein [Cutibacterium sp.]